MDAPNSYPPWAPRIWTGLMPWDYWSYLAENRFAIHPGRYPMTVLVAMWTLLNTGFAGIQNLGWRTRIEKTELSDPPIFIVGHWRSGTTLLHELMSLDKRLAFPSNFDAFVPNHFLVSGLLVRPLLKLLLPNKRPMDNMSVGVDSPQEDDFALMILGAASQYRRMGFPQNRNEYFKWLDAANLSDSHSENVRRCLTYFYKALTYKYGKRLVLKSPPHTGRIQYLAKWFPGAKFVHISRHPYSVVPSSMRLWMVVDDVHSFHPRRYNQSQLLEYVNSCQREMYRAYIRDRSMLADDQLVEVSFEDLTSNPSATIESIYHQLGLEGANEAVETASAYFSRKRDHKKNKHQIHGLISTIDLEWAEYMHQFGYESEAAPRRANIV